MKKLLLLPVTIACILGMYQISPYRQPKQETIDLICPQVSDLRDMVVLQGRIVDRAPIRLYPKGTAVVREIYVEPGEYVKAGQPLLCLEQTNEEHDLRDSAAAAMLQVQKALENGDLAAAQALANAMISSKSSQDSRQSNTKVYQLYSPVDCVVMEIRSTVGETVSELLPCLVLCDSQNLIIEAEVGEDTVAMLQEDLYCEITIPAFDLQALEGRVETIMPYARQTGLLSGNTNANTTMRISVYEKKELRPGYRAEIKVITAYKHASLLLPYEAIRQDEDGQEYVKRLKENIVVRQDIQTGSELDTQVEILEGLTAQNVVLLWPDAVQEGAYIQYDIAGTDSAGT